jgi:hypothetical protein
MATMTSPGWSPARRAGDCGSTRLTTAPPEPQRFGDVGRQVLDLNAEAAAPHFAIGHELLHDAPRHIDGHGEADADVAAGRTQNRRVDADQFAAEIDEGAA